MSVTTDILTGLALYLHNAAIGVTYRPAGGYLTGETGVVFKELPTGPDRCVALTAYATRDQPKIAQSYIRVQFWFRGTAYNNLDVDELGDAVFGVLQGLEGVQFGSAYVAQILRTSSSQLGADANQRTSRTDNYELTVDVPVTPGRPW